MIYIDDKYENHICYVKEVFGEVDSKKDFCRVYEGLIRHNGEDIDVFFLYFGVFGKICLRRDFKYEKFDSIIDSDANE